MKSKKLIMFLIIALTFLCGCSTKENQAEENQTLVLAVLFDNPGLSSAVAKFNKEHENMQIEIKNYLEDSLEIQDAINTIKMEIVSGAGPDLIDFGTFYSAGDASEKILLDLNVLMEQDEHFHKEDYFCNIWDTFSGAEGLHIMIPSFRINSFATSVPELMKLNQWNIETMVACYTGKPEGTILFPGETKISVFGFLCTGSIENYTNWDDGTCSFNGTSFQELLKFADRFPLQLNFLEDTSVREEFSEGRALLYPVSISNVFTTTQVGMLLGKANYIGYPMDEGNGSIAEIDSVAIGIGKNCKNKEIAWEFIKTLLDDDYQDNIKDGLPIKRSSLNKRLEEAMAPEYLENGEKAVKEKFLFEGDDPIYVYEITKENADLLISIIEKVQYNSSIDRSLYDIIMEEADFFFHEERTAEETADIIQNRAAIFIHEKK